MAGLYHGAKFAGSTTAILLNIPTETSSVVLCYDGHQLARQGRAGPAMGMSAISGFVASTVGVIALTFLAPIIAKFAVAFGPPEFACLMVFGLLLVITVTGKSPVKGFISMAVGLLLSTVGVDLFSGTQRFTFGNINLFDGVEFLVLTLGMFAVAEVLVNVEEQRGKSLLTIPKGIRNLLPTMAGPQGLPRGDRAGLDHRLPGGLGARRRFDDRVLRLLHAAEEHLASIPRSSARAPWRASPRRRRPTTPKSAGRWFRCSPSAYPAAPVPR